MPSRLEIRSRHVCSFAAWRMLTPGQKRSTSETYVWKRRRAAAVPASATSSAAPFEPPPECTVALVLILVFSPRFMLLRASTARGPRWPLATTVIRTLRNGQPFGRVRWVPSAHLQSPGAAEAPRAHIRGVLRGCGSPPRHSRRRRRQLREELRDRRADPADRAAGRTIAAGQGEDPPRAQGDLGAADAAGRVLHPAAAPEAPRQRPPGPAPVELDRPAPPAQSSRPTRPCVRLAASARQDGPHGRPLRRTGRDHGEGLTRLDERRARLRV